jgi:hypothetical protein
MTFEDLLASVELSKQITGLNLTYRLNFNQAADQTDPTGHLYKLSALGFAIPWHKAFRQPIKRSTTTQHPARTGADTTRNTQHGRNGKRDELAANAKGRMFGKLARTS